MFKYLKLSFFSLMGPNARTASEESAEIWWMLIGLKLYHLVGEIVCKSCLTATKFDNFDFKK